MSTSPEFKRKAIRHWEKRRIAYNLILVLPALFGWGVGGSVPASVGDRAYLGFVGVSLLFILAALGANVCYSFVYALEFLFLTEEEGTKWERFGRRAVFVGGCLLGVVLALFGGRNIAFIQYSGI